MRPHRRQPTRLPRDPQNPWGFSMQEHWSGLPFPSPMHGSEKWKVKVKSLCRVRILATPWTAAHQAPPSMGFSRQEYWSGLPLPSLLVTTDSIKGRVMEQAMGPHASYYNYSLLQAYIFANAWCTHQPNTLICVHRHSLHLRVITDMENTHESRLALNSII